MYSFYFTLLQLQLQRATAQSGIHLSVKRLEDSSASIQQKEPSHKNAEGAF